MGGSRGGNVLYGDSTGSNSLQGGGGGNNTLYAGSGGDYLDGGPGLNAFYGGPGADTLVVNFNPAGGTDQDTLSGGLGDDTLLIEGRGQDDDIYLDMVPGTSETYNATLTNNDTEAYEGAITFTLPTDVQQIAIQGGPGNDKIQVDPSVYRDVTIVGGEGNDTLIAGSGNDVLAGGPGNNLLAGGSGNAGNVMIGDLEGTKTNPDTMVGGAGFDTMLGGNGNELMLADDSTARAQGFWSQVVATARQSFDVLLMPPPNPLANLTTTSQFLDELNTLQTQDNELIEEINQLALLKAQYIAAAEPVPLAVQSQLTDLGNAQEMLSNEIEPLVGLITGATVDKDYLQGGTGNDTLYGGAEPALLDGGQGDDTLYYSRTQDTLFGGGGHDTVVFQDTPGTTNNVSLKYPDPNADNPNVIGVTINGQEVLWPQIDASITTVGIDLLGSVDTLTMNFTVKPMDVQVYCGSGTDTVDERGIQPPTATPAGQINGGSGDDVVIVPSDLGFVERSAAPIGHGCSIDAARSRRQSLRPVGWQPARHERDGGWHLGSDRHERPIIRGGWQLKRLCAERRHAERVSGGLDNRAAFTSPRHLPRPLDLNGHPDGEQHQRIDNRSRWPARRLARRRQLLPVQGHSVLADMDAARVTSSSP